MRRPVLQGGGREERCSCHRPSASSFSSCLSAAVVVLALLRSATACCPLPAAVRVSPTVICGRFCSQAHRPASSQPSDSLELDTQQICPTITTTICCRPSQDRPRQADSTSRRETAGHTNTHNRQNQPAAAGLCVCADLRRFDCWIQQHLTGRFPLCVLLCPCLLAVRTAIRRGRMSRRRPAPPTRR
jgi:hypothetical protein